MSEERKLILKMVAEGKVTPDEAEMLLQAMDESERATLAAAPAPAPAPAQPAASEGFQGLDRALSGLEEKLQRKLEEQRIDQLPMRMEERLRQAADRAAQRARGGEGGERPAAAGGAPAQRSRMIKMGISIDRETVQQQEELTIPTRSGDRLVLDNRIGDVAVRFTDDPEIAVEVRKTVWGADRADAEERATLTKVSVTRRGADLVLEAAHPSITAVGVTVLKDTRLDYIVRAPHGTNLQVRNKVGDLRVAAGEQVGAWDLETKVGDVDLKVGAGAGFRHHLESRIGKVYVNLPEAGPGQIGDGAGSIRAMVKTGDIRLQY